MLFFFAVVNCLKAKSKSSKTLFEETFFLEGSFGAYIISISFESSKKARANSRNAFPFLVRSLIFKVIMFIIMIL